MNSKQLDWVLDAWASRNHVFPYFKDGYAPALLRHAVGAGMTVRALRASRFAPLLDKPLLARALASLGDGRVLPEWLASLTPHGAERYRLTLGEWGDEKDDDRWWWQTTRRGKNLVLQVNFPAGHDRAYRKFLRCEDEHPFEFTSHPVHAGDLRTLSWARIDLDLDDGEALIEEVQSDWTREARGAYLDAVDSLDDDAAWSDAGSEQRRMQLYYEQVLAPHCAVWDELTLLAAILFVRETLGIRRIYYHTYRSGNYLKGLSRWAGPPRSLYERLPRRFCFERITELPRFLRRRWEDRPSRRLTKEQADERDRIERLRPLLRFYSLELD